MSGGRQARAARTVRGIAWAALLLACPAAAPAQLATSFYNVTGIQTRALPNAVQITIRTDGTVNFGGDLSDFMASGDTWGSPKPVTSFRIRLLGARARLPAFVDIGAYPVDSALVSLGTDEFRSPLFNWQDYNPRAPRVDIQLRFYVPITVRRFIIERNARDSLEGNGEEGVDTGGFLNPRDVEVKIGPDRRSIVITVISDRTDAGKAGNLRRSPPESHHHRLAVITGEPGRFRVDALHAPLAEVLDAVAHAAGLPLTARADAASVDVSLLLPSATPEEFLRALTVGYGLNVTPRPAEEGGGFSVGRNGPASQTERLPLRYLSPENARLLFPDFLLPLLHADREHNALLVSGSPALIDRLRRDLEKLDRPRPQVRVEVTAWELASTGDLTLALNAARTRGRETLALNGDTGEAAYRLKADEQQGLTAALTALEQQGRARLAARPSILVASGETGTLFLGQQRYLTVLQGSWMQTVRALRLQIGYSLTVQPILGAQDVITMDLNPRLSTVDAVEAGTGLPTLGIRETFSTVCLRAGDTVVVAGLESGLSFETRRRLSPLARLPLIGGLFVSRRHNTSRTAMLLLVTARKDT